MPESIKIAKPDKFDGKDTSITTVTAWTFSVEEYMELAEVPEDQNELQAKEELFSQRLAEILTNQ